MATIQDITPEENGADSLVAVEANFANLNADKIDKDGSVAMEADLPMGGNKITGVGTPTADTDVSTKAYADTAAGTASLWTTGSGKITPDNVTASDLCELTDAGILNFDRTIYASAGDHYGLGAGVIRATSSDGDKGNLVAAALHGHALGTYTGTVWGLALEAWTGQAYGPEGYNPIAGTNSANLVGCESSIKQQYSEQIGSCVAFHAVFSTRPDFASPGQNNHLVGSIGSNKFNVNTEAIRIQSQMRSLDGEYCGWNTGIKFTEYALDRTATEGYSTLIDFSEIGGSAGVDASTDNNNGYPWILKWSDTAANGGVMGIRYNAGNHLLEFYRGLDTTPTRAGYIDMVGSDHAL